MGAGFAESYIAEAARLERLVSALNACIKPIVSGAQPRAACMQSYFREPDCFLRGLEVVDDMHVSAI